MPPGKDKNYISFWSWMFLLFVAALPCVGFIMVVVWAFIGENRTRKNYFRAVIVWQLIITVLVVTAWVGIMALGFSPQLQKIIQQWTHQPK